MTTIRIPQKTTFSGQDPNVSSITPDAWHTSSIECWLAEQTTSLWAYNLGTRHTYAWDDASRAPRCNITAYNTWTDFVWTQDNQIVTIPYYSQLNFNLVGMMIGLAMPPGKMYFLKAILDPMTGAANESIPVDIASGNLWTPRPGWIQAANLTYRTQYIEMAIGTADAQGLYSLHLQAKMLTEDDSMSSVLEPYLYLHGVTVFDLIKDQL